MGKEKKVTIDVNKEEVTIAILNYSDSNVHIETITIWWEAEESWGTTNSGWNALHFPLILVSVH